MLDQMGVEDWCLTLYPNEEEDEITRLRRDEQEVNIAQRMQALGFQPELTEDAGRDIRFVYKKPDPQEAMMQQQAGGAGGMPMPPGGGGMPPMGGGMAPPMPPGGGLPPQGGGPMMPPGAGASATGRGGLSTGRRAKS